MVQVIPDLPFHHVSDGLHEQFVDLIRTRRQDYFWRREDSFYLEQRLFGLQTVGEHL